MEASKKNECRQTVRIKKEKGSAMTGCGKVMGSSYEAPSLSIQGCWLSRAIKGRKTRLPPSSCLWPFSLYLGAQNRKLRRHSPEDVLHSFLPSHGSLIPEETEGSKGGNLLGPSSTLLRIFRRLLSRTAEQMNEQTPALCPRKHVPILLISNSAMISYANV